MATSSGYVRPLLSLTQGNRPCWCCCCWCWCYYCYYYYCYCSYYCCYYYSYYWYCYYYYCCYYYCCYSCCYYCYYYYYSCCYCYYSCCCCCLPEVRFTYLPPTIQLVWLVVTALPRLVVLSVLSVVSCPLLNEPNWFLGSSVPQFLSFKFLSSSSSVSSSSRASQCCRTFSFFRFLSNI